MPLTALNEDDRMFQSAVRKFAREQIGPRVREMDEGHVSSCAKSRYAVFPEDFWSGLEQNENGLWLGKTVVVPRSVIKAKINWQTAYRKHWIHYERFDG